MLKKILCIQLYMIDHIYNTYKGLHAIVKMLSIIGEPGR